MSTDKPASQQADSPDAPQPVTEDERVLAEAGRAADAGQVSLTCPVCGLVNRPGELACARCGTILVTGGTTRKLGANDETP